jgi:hypothetical protein
LETVTFAERRVQEMCLTGVNRELQQRRQL